MKKILIVEDAQPVSNMLRDVLLLRGFNIVGEVSQGNKILSTYKKLKPDLVIMDIILPDMDGLMAAKEIINFDPRAKIIAMTGANKPNLKEEALNLGIKSFLKKPFTNTEFIESVNNVLK